MKSPVSIIAGPRLKANAGRRRRRATHTALRGMDVDELLRLRQRIDKVIAKNAPEVEARIAALQDMLKTIKGAARK